MTIEHDFIESVRLAEVSMGPSAMPAARYVVTLRTGGRLTYDLLLPPDKFAQITELLEQEAVAALGIDLPTAATKTQKIPKGLVKQGI